jgi:hypothetical protein
MNHNLGIIIKDATTAGYKAGWLAGILSAVQSLHSKNLIKNKSEAEQILAALISTLPPDLLEKN